MSAARADVVLPVSLHARPAALVARAAAAHLAQVRLGGANARSVTELMCLGARAGRQVEISAEGPDAEQAVAEVRHVVERLGDRAVDEGDGR